MKGTRILEKEVIDMDLEKIFNDQKTYYDTLMTRDVSLRIDAIKRVKLWIKDHMDLIEDALEKDLGKSRGESYMTEIGLTLEACTYTGKDTSSSVLFSLLYDL